MVAVRPSMRKTNLYFGNKIKWQRECKIGLIAVHQKKKKVKLGPQNSKKIFEGSNCQF